MSSPLTSGFCQRAFAEDAASDEKPVVQILSVKKINANGQSGQDRYRLVIIQQPRLVLTLEGSSCPMEFITFSRCSPLSSILM